MTINIDYVRYADPFVKIDDIECMKWINDFDLYVKFKTGRKVIIYTSEGSTIDLIYTKENIPNKSALRWLRYEY